jgi:hypothetical protein
MENNNFNLLDLGDDILNIIGDYVKADNDERDFQNYLREEVIHNSFKLFEIIKKSRWNENKPAMILLIFFMSIIFGILKLLIYI